MLDKDDITKEEFDLYRNVQMSGEYNMITQASDAMEAADLDKETYWTIIKNYSYLRQKFTKKNVREAKEFLESVGFTLQEETEGDRNHMIWHKKPTNLFRAAVCCLEYGNKPRSKDLLNDYVVTNWHNLVPLMSTQTTKGENYFEHIPDWKHNASYWSLTSVGYEKYKEAAKFFGKSVLPYIEIKPEQKTDDGLQKELIRIMANLTPEERLEKIEQEEDKILAGKIPTDTVFVLPKEMIPIIRDFAKNSDNVVIDQIGKIDKKQVKECYSYCSNVLNRRFHIGKTGIFDLNIQDFYNTYKIVFLRGFNESTLHKIFNEVCYYLIEKLEEKMDSETSKYWKNKLNVNPEELDDFNESTLKNALNLLKENGYCYRLNEERGVREITNKILEAMEQGTLDYETVARAGLAYLSEDQVEDMARSNDWMFLFEDEADDEDDDELEDDLD